MNADTFISWLIHSDWLMLVIWIVLLGAAFGFTLFDRPAEAPAPRRDAPPNP